MNIISSIELWLKDLVIWERQPKEKNIKNKKRGKKNTKKDNLIGCLFLINQSSNEFDNES